MDTAMPFQQDRHRPQDSRVIRDKFATHASSKIHWMSVGSPLLARVAAHKLAARSFENCLTVKLVLPSEIINRGSEIEERELCERETSYVYHLLPAVAGFISPQNLLPTLQPPQTISPHFMLQSTNYQPHQNYNLGNSQLSLPRQSSPMRVPEPSIELSDISLRQGEEPPLEGELEDSIAQIIGEERPQSICSLPLCGVAIFLAPLNIVLGMTASHGDVWKLTFTAFFILWLIVGTTWLFLDLYSLQNLPFTKRCFWHLAGCVASLYFFMSIIHITSDILPQWLPTILDCGVGTSLGFQNIPETVLHRVGESITNVVASIFGGTQVIIQRDEQPLVRSGEPLSPRVRRPDIETGLTA